jgi:hypothetical protein
MHHACCWLLMKQQFLKVLCIERQRPLGAVQLLPVTQCKRRRHCLLSCVFATKLPAMRTLPLVKHQTALKSGSELH